MTTFLLVRHGAHDLLDRALAGRTAGVALNDRGRVQAQELIARLRPYRIDAIYCSPQQRARETAQPLAAERRLELRLNEGLDEIDFGEWTGLSFEQLRTQQDEWRTWVEHRSVACPPGGESFACVAQRTMSAVEKLAELHPRQQLLLVSHGDVIKSLVARVLGISLDDLERFEIAPASLSIVAVEGSWRQVKRVNETPAALA